MTESGGSATQAGIYYQNSVAALALADLLDLDQHAARERVLEVRVEAPDHVDDIVVRFADGHHDFQSVKLGLRVGNMAWTEMWRSLDAQRQAAAFGVVDQLTIVVNERGSASDAVTQLCERASSSIDIAEFTTRLSDQQQTAWASIRSISGSADAAFELLQRTRLLHLPLDGIANELGRRRLMGATGATPKLLSSLRDIVGGAARKRGLFRPASLRRRLKLDFDMTVGEPVEWGLATYRTAVRELARIEIPGTAVSGPAEQLFVWPRARELDATRPSDFEDENPDLLSDSEEAVIDLRTFPTDQLDRVVIVAGPGHGKSALLTAIAGQLSPGPLVPVTIPLASLASADSSVVRFLHTTMSKELELSADWERLAEQGLLVLLFDGLDEVPSTNRPALLQRIANFSVRYPHAAWMLTVRDAAVLNGLPPATTVELLALNDEDIERFAENMKDHIGGLAPWEVARRLKLYPDLDRLARIPLFLMMLLVTTDLKTPQPITRSDLIESYLTTLFAPERRKATGSGDDLSAPLRAIAETLAFERLERQEIGATEREVREIINRTVPDTKDAETLFDRLRTNGILKPQSAIRLQFPYPIVQEYLAARHLIDHFPVSLTQRIEDAVQRPWAQVIQFALELSPNPEPVIEAMLERPDDAFATGLRLVGRCIANGAKVSNALRLKVGERLVDFWIHAPSQSRERVGRVLADGFADLKSAKLDKALHHRWLMNSGAGDILSGRKDDDLTISVLETLIEEDRSSSGIYHSFKVALRAAGNLAISEIVGAMDPDTRTPKEINEISGLFWNFTTASISTEIVLEAARDPRLPRQARMRAYKLVGPPLEDAGISLVRDALQDADWESNYASSDLIPLHPDPPAFFEDLLLDLTISADRRQKIAGSFNRHVADPALGREMVRRLVANPTLEAEIKTTLRLMDARYGNAEQFRSLIDDIPELPIEHGATTIALFGHYPDRELAEHAARVMRARAKTSSEMARVAGSLTTGLRGVFEMDWGFGGAVRPAPPHPGILPWIELVEDWSDVVDLAPQDRMRIRTAAAGMGSASVAAALERDLLAIVDFDDPAWLADDEHGHTISSALYPLRRKIPSFPDAFIERLLRSKRYNIASYGVRGLGDRGDEASLIRLIALHRSDPKWLLRDQAANTIETLAARLQIVVRKKGNAYTLAERAPAS